MIATTFVDRRQPYPCRIAESQLARQKKAARSGEIGPFHCHASVWALKENFASNQTDAQGELRVQPDMARADFKGTLWL